MREGRGKGREGGKERERGGREGERGGESGENCVLRRGGEEKNMPAKSDLKSAVMAARRGRRQQ